MSEYNIEDFRKAKQKLFEDTKSDFDGVYMVWFDGYVFYSLQDFLDYIKQPTEDDPVETIYFR